MTTVMDYHVCDGCGQEYLYSFDLKTKEYKKVSMCYCDKVSYRRKKLKDRYRKQARYFKQKSDTLVSYKAAYNILMEYWDSLPDEEKSGVHKRLVDVGV